MGKEIKFSFALQDKVGPSASTVGPVSYDHYGFDRVSITKLNKKRDMIDKFFMVLLLAILKALIFKKGLDSEVKTKIPTGRHTFS